MMASAPRAAGGRPVKKATKRAKPKPAPKAPETLQQVVIEGDHRRALEAMASKLAEDWDLAPVTIRPQIAGRLQAVLAELATLPEPKTKSRLDELADRRKARMATAQALAAAQGEGL